MKDYNSNISDKEIRELLKRRLLDQNEDDLLTQKLIDMEAKLVFGNEVLSVPSLQKEKKILKKLSAVSGSSPFLKWALPCVLIVLLSTILLFYNQSVVKTTVLPISNKVLNSGQKTHHSGATLLTDSARDVQRISIVKKLEKKPVTIAAQKEMRDEERGVADLEIKTNRSPLPILREKDYKPLHGNIPVFTEKQIAENNKLKDKVLKALLKKDKKAWALIPMGTDVFYGETISIYAFYMATTEVTNQQYTVFLNDLVIHGKIEEYVRAVPDTTKWNITGLGDNGEMVNNYFWHHKYNTYPVVNISREGAEMYCKWLTVEANEKIKADNFSADVESLFINDVRIPQETEWMMAARGGNTGAEYPWGTGQIQNAKGCFLCNFGLYKSADKLDISNSSCSHNSKALTSAGSVMGESMLTGPSDSYNPNAYGLFCMSGNVAEMVLKNKTNKPGTKGGSWDSKCEDVKINAADEYAGITEASPYIGFRVVFTAKKNK